MAQGNAFRLGRARDRRESGWCSRGVPPRSVQTKTQAPPSHGPLGMGFRSHRPGRRAPATPSRGGAELGVDLTNRGGTPQLHRADGTGECAPPRPVGGRRESAWCSRGVPPRSVQTRTQAPPSHGPPEMGSVVTGRGDAPQLHRSEAERNWGSTSQTGTGTPRLHRADGTGECTPPRPGAERRESAWCSRGVPPRSVQTRTQAPPSHGPLGMGSVVTGRGGAPQLHRAEAERNWGSTSQTGAARPGYIEPPAGRNLVWDLVRLKP